MGESDAAVELAKSFPGEWIIDQRARIPRALPIAGALALLGEEERARPYFQEARRMLEEAVREDPDDPRLRVALGHTYGGLGRKEEALEQGRRAVELMPISVDAVQGPRYLLELAVIQAAVGERSAALDTLGEYLSVPGDLSLEFLELDPRFASLREMEEWSELVDRY